MIDPALLAAYRATNYNVTALSLVLKIDQRNHQLDELMEKWHQKEWALITAHNPQSIRLSTQQNAENHNKLKQMLGNLGYNMWKSEAIDPKGKWPIEYGFFIPGMGLDQARMIAGKFGQLAFLHGFQKEKVNLNLV